MIQKINFNFIKNSKSIYFLNSLWMIADRGTNILSAFAWSIILARSLSIENFGAFNAVTASIAILLPVAAFGLNSLLNKILLVNKGQDKNIVLTAFILKIIAGIVCCIIVNLWFYYGSALEFNKVNFVYSLVILLHSLQVFESLNQAYSTSKVVTFSRFITVFIFLIIKVTLYLLNILSLEIALYIQALEFFVYFFLLALISSRKHKKILAQSEKLTKTNFSGNSKIMLSGGFLLILSGVAETINLKIDIIMLTELSSLDSVSIYSVATKFSEAGYFFAAAIATSFFPKILKARDDGLEVYYDSLRNLAIKLLIMSGIVFAITLILAYPVIVYLYGVEYLASYKVLAIHLVASFLVYFRAVFSKWLVAEDLFKYSLLTHLCGGVSNVLLNIWLIPLWGYYGAAASTVISYAMSSYISLLFFKEPRDYLTNIRFNIFRFTSK